MKLPEKTLLAASSLLLFIPGMRALVQWLDGTMIQRMHAAASAVPQPAAYRVGFVVGFLFVMGIELLCALGLFALFLKRMRAREASGEGSLQAR